MNYSLFIMVMKEMMSMEAKGQPGAAPATSLLLYILESLDPFHVFSISTPPHREITEGGYI
jgi:hypothetical protein